MKTRAMLALTTIAFLFATSADASLFGKKKNVDEERQEVIEVREKTLARLYKEKPAAEAMVKDSVGYAVFSNTGINLLLVSTANGKGISRDNESGDDVYMKMFSAGGGLGLGVKKFSAVFIFHSRDAFDQFVEKGWNFTAQADAAATTDDSKEGQPGATEATIGLSAGVTVYQMTEKGLALQATLQGTKYWQDEDLNSD